MEWASEKWQTEARVAQNVVLTAPTFEIRDKAKADIAKLFDKNIAAHKTRYIFRTFIFLMAWAKFFWSLYVIQLAWNSVIHFYTGWPVITMWGAIVLRVAVMTCVKTGPSRKDLDLIEAAKNFENSHHWFDRYFRKWEVVYMGLFVLAVIHLFLIYAPLR